MSFGPSLLFCPADRPERFAKAASAADTVIIDLEDAVAPEHKVAAREALAASDLDPARTIVRVNPVPTADFELDLAAVARTGYRTLMLAKAQGADELDRLAGYRVIALCETPLGVREAESIAANASVVALSWGAEDLVAAIGGSSSSFDDGRYRGFAAYARAKVLIAAASEGKDAYDTVHLDIADDDGLSAKAADAAASGFAGFLCIHPRQVEPVRAAFRPSEEALLWATELLEAARTADGVFAHRGRMVDGPVIRQAERIVETAAVETPRGSER
jgi:citrate lyase subunit beta/citryl-CoA lyase